MQNEGQHGQQLLAVPALRCLGFTTACGSASACAHVLDSGLPCILACAGSQHVALQQEAAWVLSNLACLASKCAAGSIPLHESFVPPLLTPSSAFMHTE